MSDVREVEYREVPSFPGYRVGSDGTVWTRLKRQPNHKIAIGNEWRLMKPTILQGYPRVCLYESGKKRYAKVAILVLEAFVGPRPQGMEACHFPDRDRTNSRLDNLRWDTKEANEADMAIHGTRPRGGGHWNARLTDDDVASIRASSRSHSELAAKFGVSRPYIRDILNGKMRRVR